MSGHIADAIAARREARIITGKPTPTSLHLSYNLSNAMHQCIQQARQTMSRMNNIMDRAIKAGYTKDEILVHLTPEEKAEAIEICINIDNLANHHRATSEVSIPLPFNLL